MPFPSVRVILVRPQHDGNVGAVCRAMSNFGLTELYVVNPVAQLGHQATLYAKHAEHVLNGITKTKTLTEALRGCDVSIATTGKTDRFRKSDYKNCVSIHDAFAQALRTDAKRIAIVFGAEGLGLSDEEFAICDVYAHIPTHPDRPVMNLSHSVAVCLYELHQQRLAWEAREKGASGALYPVAHPSKIKHLVRNMTLLSSRLKRVRDPQRLPKAFERVVRRAVPSEEECGALFAIVKSALSQIPPAPKATRKRKS